MKNITVTGISGYIGTKLINQLHTSKDEVRIVGIDTREPRLKSPKLRFYNRDISQPFDNLLRENDVDTVVHLAFILRPTRQKARARQIDIGGMQNLLNACRKAGVRHIVYLSSHTVYGAFRDNPVPLTEDAPLRPVPGFQYSQDKIETEKILNDYISSERDVTLTVLRSCPVLGPNAVGSATTIMFQPPMMIGVAGYDPLMQFIHEDDLIGVIAACLALGKGGIYNVAGGGTLKYSQVARRLGKRLLKLPGKLLEPVISFSWATHLQSASPAGGVEFIKYPPVVSTEKVGVELGYEFRYSSEQALAAFADKN